MSAYFVTATGTDCGKTYVTAGLIRAMREAGRAVAAVKPVLSGYDPAEAAQSDAGVLLAAMGKAVDAANVAAIAPWRYAAALSPDMAAARENRAVDLPAILQFCAAAQAAAEDVLLIEGVGGVMVPLNAESTVRDWMVALDLPVILVAGTYLGTISHTLTTVEALRISGVKIAVIVLSESLASPVPPEETASVIMRFCPGIPVRVIPRDLNDTSFRALAAFLG